MIQIHANQYMDISSAIFQGKLPWNVLNRLHKNDRTAALKFSLDNVNANED